MVKTFLCHPFNEEKEFTDQYNPSCFCSTRDSRYLIGSLYGTINVVELNKNTLSGLYKFPSVAIPVKMIFCDQKQFLLSLESRLQDYRTGMLTKEMNCQARVYCNITMGTIQKQSQHLSSGYSSNLNSFSHSKEERRLTTIELTGLRQHVTDISLCNINNNIAVSSSRKIYLYAYKECEVGLSDRGINIDFIRLVEVETTLVIRSVSLASNWLAFSSKTEIRAIQIHLNQPTDHKVYQGEEITESIENNAADQLQYVQVEDLKIEEGVVKSKEDDLVVWNFKQGNAVNHSNWFQEDSGANLIQFQSIQEEKPFDDTNASSKEILGEHESLVGHPLCCSFVGQNSSDTEFATVASTTHLYRRFEKDEISFSGNTDKIHSLQWLPVFAEGHKQLENENNLDLFPWKMFSISSNEALLTMPLFFSTGTHGYLYDVCGSGALITSYDYISDCHRAVYTNSMLCTLTSNGMELYTSRLYPFVAEYFVESEKEKENISAIKHQNTECNKLQEVTDTDLFLATECLSDYPASNSKERHQQTSQVKCVQHKKFYIYSKELLLQPCPSKDLETCLIGMYPHQNLVDISSNSSNLTLFVKTPRKKEKSASNAYSPWNIITLQKPHVTDVYKEINKLIEGNEFSNPAVYHQLLCESYVLVCSAQGCQLEGEAVLSDTLKEIATTLSTFYMRCDSSFDFTDLGKYCLLAGMQPKDVVLKLKKQSQSGGRKNILFGPGTIGYLNSLLFGDEVVDFGKEDNEFILHVYGKNSPSLLSKLILHSKLKRNYSLDLCVKLLSKYKRKIEAKEERLSPFEHLCFAFLHMQLGNPGHAEELLKEIPEDALKLVCVENSDLVLTKNYEKLTIVGQLMKKYFKPTFQAILVCMFERGTITADNILALFKTIEGTVMYSYQACEVLESILNDSSHRKRYTDIIMLLVDQYLLRLGKGLRSEGWKITHNHELTGNGHFASRFTWLDKLPPFSGDVPCPQDCIINKSSSKYNADEQISKSASPSLHNLDVPKSGEQSRVLSSSNKVTDASKLMKKREYCPCCCCSEVLTKFQSLLCSKYCRKELSGAILKKLEDHSFVGKESLQLLCWPKAGNAQEAIDYIVKNYPKLTLQYAKEMFEWKLQWQLLLQQIFSILKINDEQWNQDVYLDILKGALLRLTRAFSPQEFLNLLPKESNAVFMLPYLMECIEYSNSTCIKNLMIDTYKENEEAE